MRMRVLLLGCFLAAGLGCGSGKFVPVSGKVTLNGKALPGAIVSFEPLGSDGAPSGELGSTGKTEADGTFRLQSTDGSSGAVPGKHRVRISLADDGGDERPTRHRAPTIPRRYNASSDLTTVVPASGTSDAVFPLTSP
jgi:hypothetical protein